MDVSPVARMEGELMTDWYSFDPLDADERAEQDAIDGEIAAAERSAVDAIRELGALVERHGLPAESGSGAALTHIATLAQAQSQTLFRRSLQRDQRRKQRLTP